MDGFLLKILRCGLNLVNEIEFYFAKPKGLSSANLFHQALMYINLLITLVCSLNHLSLKLRCQSAQP